MRQLILNCFIGATLIVGIREVCGADAAKTPKAGEKAPLIEANDQDGHLWKLKDAAGKQAVLLYFYPKDNTPGCTKEACGLRDRMSELKKSNVQVIGGSFDPAASHHDFIKKYNLNFPLLVHSDGKI